MNIVPISIERIEGNVEPVESAALLCRDGAVIVHGALTASQLVG